MYATMRYYAGNPGLADELAARKDEILQVIQPIAGFRNYFLVRLGDATVSITVCDDEAGTEASTRAAAEWISGNMPDVAASPPMISSGEVVVSG